MDWKLFVRLVDAARSLNEPGEVNSEYARGQAELICDAAGLDTDYKDLVTEVITHENAG